MNSKIEFLSPFGVLIQASKKNIDVKTLDILKLKTIVGREHLLILRGFKTFTHSDDFSTYCHHWGEIAIWPFGKVLELIEQNKPKDHIFDHSYVPLHWDGMYRPQVPELQLFHCANAPSNGDEGRTTFSNTISTLKNAPPEIRELWKKATGIYKRKMEFYESTTKSPIVTKHPYKNYSVIRYNEIHSANNGHLINPVKSEFLGIKDNEQYLLHKSLKENLYSEKNFYAHQWQKGDIVISDNFSLLHGREKFTSKDSRHIQRVQILSDPPLSNPGLESYQ